MRTPPGLINQKIEIYRDEDIQDGSGGTIPNSVLYWSTSAQVRTISARRDLAQAQEQLKPAFEFIISDRIDKTVRPNMLIKYRDGWFTITNCEPDYTYQQMLRITAISSDQLRRGTETPTMVTGYIWFTPYDEPNTPLTEEEILTKDTFQFSSGQDFEVLMNSFGQYVYPNIAYPATEPTKTRYQNTDVSDDNGDFGTGKLLDIALTTGSFKQHNGTYPIDLNATYLIKNT